MRRQGCDGLGLMEKIISYNTSEKLAVRVGMSCIQDALGLWATNVGLNQLHSYVKALVYEWST